MPFAELGTLWSAPVAEGGPGAAYYRPVAMTILAVAGRIGPVPIHLLALVLHCASTFALVYLFRTLRAPLLGAIVFAVHPLAGEVLGWASALPDALAVALTLGALVWSTRPTLNVVLLLLAILSKETAAVMAAGLLLACGSGRGAWIRWAAAVMVAMSLRVAAGVGSLPISFDKLELVPSALGWGWGAVVWPLPLHVVRDVTVSPPEVVIMGWLVIAAAAWRSGRSREAWAGLLLFISAFLVALPVVLDGYLLGARYAYPALVGVGLWLAAIAPRWGRGVVLVLGMPSLVFHSVDSQRWRDDLALFDGVEERAYGSGLAWHLWGVVNLEASQFVVAATALEKAMASDHPYPGDDTLCIAAWVSAGNPRRALEVAENGQKDGLTASHLAWWARAAWGAGEVDRARGLLEHLRTPKGFDGPEWVPSFAAVVFKADPATPRSSPQVWP